MASIDTIFHQAVSGGIDTAIIVVSNQPDGLVTYTAGRLQRVSDSTIGGSGSMLLSDRLLDYPVPSGGAYSQIRFNRQASQELQITLTSPSSDVYELELNIPPPFNRDFYLSLTVYGDLAYG